MQPLPSESFVFDPRPEFPLVSTVKRYAVPAAVFSTDPEALTLIVTHGTGFHKEQWEPTLQYLFDLLVHNAQAGDKLRVHEVWAIDCPNHGDAAVLNEDTLKWGYSEYYPWEDYGRSVHMFVAGLGTGIPVDFSTRKLVGVAHSMGCIALTLAQTYTPRLSFTSFIYAETIMTPPPWTWQPNEGSPTAMLAQGAAKRRDVWPSREEAFKSLSARGAFKIWDPRVLRIFVEQGMRELPTLEYPDKTEGVTLKCTRAQEAACYRDMLGRTRAYNYLGTLCQAVPVHMIYGMINDYLPEEAKSDILEVAMKGKYATLQRVKGAGHLIVQMQPEGLANAVYTALTKTPPSVVRTRSKL